MAKQYTVLYDPQMFDIQQYGGISRYFANLISGVKKTKGFKAKLPLVYAVNYYVRDFPQLLPVIAGKKYLKKPHKRIRWNLRYARFKIRNSKFDVFHASYYNPYFLEGLKKPLVVTVHDMIHENYPRLFENSDEVIEQKKLVIQSADLIIAISTYTRDQVIRYYPHLSEKIRVVYHGIPDHRIDPAQEELPKKFILYVGDRFAVYKNFAPLIKAIAKKINSEHDIHLICAGGGPFNEDELALFEKYAIQPERVIQVNASDEQMAQLYQQALIFIYPSLEEGFGFPMLEAFKNGCAIACSNTSCLPEVGGNAASYFDPANQESMIKTISALIDDAHLRGALIQEGYQQLKKFTFDNCLARTLECYQSLV
jgi:glycosyltransferase involved in cell wall biosynthesis